MSELKLISPMLDNFTMGDPYSNNHGVRCCPAVSNTDKKYIVKIISIPASQVQLQALLLTGACQSEAAARDYFLELVQGVVGETEILSSLSRHEGFLPFEDHQIVPMENEVGYDVYLLSPYRRSLSKYLRKTNITHLAAINLGLDLCAALTVSRHAGYLYADLKPDNIFVCNDREFRIGDLGFLRMDSLKFASLPDRCIGPYTAPEIVDAFSDVNPTIDIYAAGMILYQIYNGGSLPFLDRAGNEPLPAPAYADYELAEIILKACAPDPADRWQDPYEMGQALVAYMQRNSVNDTPIVAPMESHEEPAPDAQTEQSEELPLEQEDTADAPSVEQICLDDFYAYLQEAPEEAPADETLHIDLPEEAADQKDIQIELPDEDSKEEEDYLNLSFMDDLLKDDTVPSEEMAGDISYDDVSEDASSILSMADCLISEPEETAEPEAPDSVVPISQVIDDATKVIKEPVAVAVASGEDSDDDDEDWFAAEKEADEDFDDYDARDDMKSARRKSATRQSEQRRSANKEKEKAEKKEKKKKGSGKWIALICVLLLLAALAVGGYLFYRDYYLRSVSTLVLEGSEDQLIVKVSANVDESLLTVTCYDTYGTPITSPVTDGKAVFTGLTPNTLYRVEVNVEGLRKLTGKIADSYSTPVQTDILTFDAVTGELPGTAILSFTLDGMDSTAWSVTYWAEGVEEQKAIFSGHTVNISDLVIGKTYTFRLEAGSNLYITGNDTLEYTAVEPVTAENLMITGCTADSLDVSWTAPEGAQISSWIVRCYNDADYDETIVVETTAVTFTGLNGNLAYTVEVQAEGMSTRNRCYMSANAVTVSNITATQSNTSIIVSWDFSGNTPTGAWILTYQADNASFKEMVSTNTNSAVIYPLIPGAQYTLSVLLEDGTTVFSQPVTVQMPEAERFSGYLTGADYITASMCRTPANANWSQADVKKDDYTDTFASGEKASFLLYTKRTYNTSSDIITTMFVIHDEEGRLVSSNITQDTWTRMWYKRYCELDIPALPEEPGTYTISIYFNGAFLHSQNFYITEG